MHGPAPVSLEAAGDEGAWRHGVLGLHLMTATVLLVWRPELWTVAVAVALALAGVAAWRADLHSARGRLHWDGQRWTLDECAVQPAVAVDLGGWMLLRLRRPGARFPLWPPLWRPLSVRRAGAAWVPLRAALYANSAPTVHPTGGPAA